MFSIQRETGLAVIKFWCGFEWFGGMAPAAIRCSVRCELTGMNVFMATGAGCWQANELLAHLTAGFFDEMTITAGFFCMGTGQLKVGFWMIKTDGVPSVHVVAIFTRCLGIVFLVNKRFMDILMAITAVLPYISEIPFCLLLMACNTRSCHMSTFQPERTLVMLFNGIWRFGKTINRMTCGTIGGYPLFRELVVMVIRVAVCTPAKF